MIGFRNMGRLGNFLFQAAHTIAFALKHNQEFSFPSKTIDPFWYPLYLQHLVNPKWEQGREDVLINEQVHEWQHIEFLEEWNDKQVVLNGYWQSEKYFKDYRSEILYLFDLPYERKDGYVAVHVRRGDYLHLTMKHPIVTREWYANLITGFGAYKFKFFSDDIKWCRQEFGNTPNCEFSTNSNEMEDMIEGSCCEHAIISSSTFGWWLAWLNRNPKKIICLPKLWFQPGWDNKETKDIVPENWIKL